MRGVARRQRALAKPSARDVARVVAQAQGIPGRSVLERRSGQAFKHAVHLLLRRANLPLCEVSALAGVSVARVSQIQSRLEAETQDERLQQCLAQL